MDQQASAPPSKVRWVNGTYLIGLINLTYLAPDIITKIVEGSAPPHPNLKRLICGFPISWQEQRKGGLTVWPAYLPS